MIPRQTPLCVTHFLSHAQNNLNVPLIQCETKAARKKVIQNPLPPRRVQPRRAAKDRVKAYTDDGIEEYREEAAGDVKPTRSQLKKSMLWKTIDALLEQERLSKDCKFGAKPLVCKQCQENRIAEIANSVTVPGTLERQGRAPEAAMAPDSNVRVTLDWNGIDIAKDRQFQWKNHWFTVDACNEPMILMLQ